MIRSDVQAEQVELCRALDAYVQDHKSAIEAKSAAVRDHGSLKAAGAEATLGNARIATYSEALFLEATHRADG